MCSFATVLCRHCGHIVRSYDAGEKKLKEQHGCAAKISSEARHLYSGAGPRNIRARGRVAEEQTGEKQASGAVQRGTAPVHPCVSAAHWADAGFRYMFLLPHVHDCSEVGRTPVPALPTAGDPGLAESVSPLCAVVSTSHDTLAALCLQGMFKNV